MRKQWLAGVGVLVVGIAVMGQADQGSQAPAHEGSPRFLSATLPFGEKSCLVRAEYPTTRMWRCGNTDDIEVHTTARGRRYVGDLLSDRVHPNEYGHQILASTLATALGVPGQMVWDQPMFRAISEGAHIADESP